MKTGKYYKMPKWAIQRIEAIANAYEITKTEALLRCLDQGSKWHRKNIQRQINPAFDWEPKQPGVVLVDTSTYQKFDEDNEGLERTIAIARAKWIDN